MLRVVYDESGGDDGFVSFEVDPDLAFDTDRTIEQAREYWARVDRPNLMIKIPGTEEGMPAIEEMIYEGRNINVTLLFGVEEYAQVAEAYIRGLERRLEEGKSVDINSVASFFVSRVDTEVDKRLEGAGHDDLLGKAGIANARAAYQRYEQIFLGERFAALREAGAPCSARCGPRPASRTRPTATSCTSRSSSGPTRSTRCRWPRCWRPATTRRSAAPPPTRTPPADLKALADAGIDMDDVTDQLLREGVDKFVEPMEKLLEGIDDQAPGDRHPAPAVDRRLAARRRRAARSPSASSRPTQEDVARRIWRKDDTLWGPAGQPEVANRLGWLTVTEHDARGARGPAGVRRRRCATRASRTSCCWAWAARRWRPRSSAAPSASRAAGRACTCSTRPTRAPCAASQDAIDLDHALFLVSTKSGGTIETLSLFKHFWSLRGDGQRVRRHHRPGLGPREARERARLPAHLPQRPRHRRALQRAVVLRPRARGAHGRRRRRRCCTPPAWPSTTARASSPATCRSGCGSGSRGASWRRPAATS